MSDQFDSQLGVDRLWADAVCAQCSTINAEGTLICRTCGNNLRDQRSLRMAAEQELAGHTPPIERRRVLLGLLVVFGILLVLWVGMNPDTIANRLIDAQSSTFSPKTAFWSGPDSEIYNKLAEGLDAKTPGDDVLRGVIQRPVRIETIDGLYVVTAASALGPRPIAVANVVVQNDDVFYVARLKGGGEVRGHAASQGQGNTYASSWDAAAAKVGERYVLVSGVATRKAENAYFECYGQSESNEQQTDASASQGFEFSAYPLPQ
jgi:hypothetical protein